jgi:DNA-binding response OmpR family regulator
MMAKLVFMVRHGMISRILLIEPEHHDFVVTSNQLLEHCSELSFDWAQSAGEAEKRLLTTNYDAVIVEMDLPDSKGMDIVVRLQAVANTIPIIVFSRCANAHFANECIMRGAQDFVLKGEVDDTLWQKLEFAFERKRQENSWRNRVEILEQVLNSMPQGVVTADAQGRLTFFNNSATELAGIGITPALPDEWTATYGIYLPDDRKTPYPTNRLPLLRAMQGEEFTDEQLFVRREDLPNGVLLSLRGRPLKNRHGIVGGFVIFTEVQTAATPAKAIDPIDAKS